MKTHRPQVSIKELESFFTEVFERKSQAKELNESQKKQLKKKSQYVLWYLDQGLVRVWDFEKDQVNAWVKVAILSHFSETNPWALNAGVFQYWDKLPVKKRSALKEVRVVPGAIARYGSFIEKGAILMPSFINVGAYVGAGTMVDTWATVGSCAQIGKRVHLSGGVGVGGVLEPAQAKPVIIEDDVFVGSRCVLVEGIRVRKGAVLGAGLVLTASTKILDRRENAKSDGELLSGEIPENAIVIPGVRVKKFSKSEGYIPCAYVIGTRSESTDKKVSLNDALRSNPDLVL
jgi:2,3,4,5-tetrahydropyridine-2-carboxylate N-succinyltransferase